MARPSDKQLDQVAKELQVYELNEKAREWAKCITLLDIAYSLRDIAYELKQHP